MRGGLIVSIHDVAPVTLAESCWWADALEVMGVSATLLVVPGPWRGSAMGRAPGFRPWLAERVAAGHEVALHGWSHTQEGRSPRWARAISRGAAEFAGLDEAESARRLAMGVDALGEIGIAEPGFTPPGWVLPAPGASAARSMGLSYLTTHLAVEDLVSGSRHTVPAVCHRPGSRLAGAGRRVVLGAPRLARALGRPLRLAIHPDDTHEPALTAATLEAIREWVGSGGFVGGYSDFLEATR